MLKSIPPFMPPIPTPLTFASTKGPRLSEEELRAGAQQLLLSLVKHPLFVLLPEKYCMLHRYVETARIGGLARTTPNMAHLTDSRHFSQWSFLRITSSVSVVKPCVRNWELILWCFINVDDGEWLGDNFLVFFFVLTYDLWTYPVKASAEISPILLADVPV